VEAVWRISHQAIACTGASRHQKADAIVSSTLEDFSLKA